MVSGALPILTHEIGLPDGPNQGISRDLQWVLAGREAFEEKHEEILVHIASYCALFSLIRRLPAS